MRNKCQSSQWYSDKFYVNIDNNAWITDVIELDKICVKCDKILECTKRLVFITLLEHNK